MIREVIRGYAPLLLEAQMPTAMEAVTILEKTTGVPLPTIKGIARQLIDDELLPKSIGRRIEQLTTREFALLFFATLCSKKVKDASRVAGTYFTLKLPAEDEMWRERMAMAGANNDTLTSGDWLDLQFRHCIAAVSKLDEAGLSEEDRRNLMFGHIELYTSHPEVRFVYQGKNEDLDMFPLKFVPDGRANVVMEDFLPSTIVKVPNAVLLRCAKEWIGYEHSARPPVSDADAA